MSRQVGYHWHLRRLMADRGMFATTDLVPLLAERGVSLSREQVYRLVARIPERLNLTTLAALCDILDCSPDELLEPYAGGPATAPGASTGSTPPARPGAHESPRHHRSRPSVRPHAKRSVAGEQRRAQVLAAVLATDPALSPAPVEAALAVVASHPAALRSLAAALVADPAALRIGAPPVVGALLTALRAEGITTLPAPRCALCSREGLALTRSATHGGVCARCRARELAEACARCGIVKPVAGRDPDRRPVCARCADRPRRECGRCGRTRRIARRAHDDEPDICDACFRSPEALCSSCGRMRPCSFAGSDRPVCASCAPRRTAVCAHCGQDRPPSANWAEGPVCEPCYTAALRHRGTCRGCHAERRLVHPPGPQAHTCADCAGLPTSHACTDCGREDKLYERGRCEGCALARRSGELLRAGREQIPAELLAVPTRS